MSAPTEYDCSIDYCGPEGSKWLTRLVPRRIWGVDINHACYFHDQDYSNDLVPRKRADDRFLDAMRDVIAKRYGRLDPRRYAAYTRAYGYYRAVRAFGGRCRGAQR